MSSHATRFTFGEQVLRATFDYSPGTPDVMYMPNGDPGYPGDPEEFEVTAIELEVGHSPIVWLDISDMLFALGDEAQERLQTAAYASWLENLERQRESDAEDRAMAQAEARALRASDSVWGDL